ncbi:MAG: crotonase/enoyl-CoA hydratase family protein [Actinomycetota bacterium]
MSDAHETLTVEQRGKVLLATMDDGKANVFSTALSTALRAMLSEAEGDDGINAVVIAGRPGRFSGGFDLSVFQAGDLGAVGEMVAAGGGLVAHAYGATVPVVAACTGHAVAAGALLLLGCDHRVGPDTDIKVGLNEVAIGLTLPDWALAIAGERLSRRHLQTSVVNAKLYNGHGAVDAGFLDAVVAPEVVVDAAVEHATTLAELDPTAYANTVAAVRTPVLERMAGSCTYEVTATDS